MMSESIRQYFKTIQQGVQNAMLIGSEARAKGLDPAREVEIRLAVNLAERVVGLISVLAPQIINSGVVERIIELEKKYGAQDWRVALCIGLEVAQEKFCKFSNSVEALEIGIRTGFAYVTVGVVSSPLDGIVSVKLKQRLDGKGKYVSLSFAGPIRNAGGTSASLSVIIADYIRSNLGYASYDATDDESHRAMTELQDYHDRVTNLQYQPSEAEVLFLMKNLPIEIAGEPSEKLEVSQYKDLPRIETNIVRSGYCLMLSSCIPLKAPKIWKNLSKWGKEMGLAQWNFLEEFLKIQKSAKSGSAKKDEQKGKVTPDYTFLVDLVAGRPILGYPLKAGGFRIRYGRSRASGLMGQGVHPATMHILDEYIATGTQLKTERPNKSAAFTPCDTIEGPIVKLDDGSVVQIESEPQAVQLRKRVREILFLGDALVDYGDFADRAQMLVPPGYCEEWWVKELEKAVVDTFGSLDLEKLSNLTEISIESLEGLSADPLHVRPSPATAFIFSQKLGIPLHPAYTFHWKDLTLEELEPLFAGLERSQVSIESGVAAKIVIPYEEKVKRALELLGVPHILVQGEFIVLEKGSAFGIGAPLSLTDPPALQNLRKALTETPSILDAFLKVSGLTVRDKSGTYMGSRMGRPEKAKLRKLTGGPHGLFPVGEEGGRMRSMNEASDAQHIEQEFALFYCEKCNVQSIYPCCSSCSTQCKIQWYCRTCSKTLQTNECLPNHQVQRHRQLKINMREHLRTALARLGMSTYPDLIKGVRGTSNQEHLPEHLAKAILRAKHDLTVNKDGTIRYDCSEMTLTHFRPIETGTSIKRLIELGYVSDIFGKQLVDSHQLLELKPQDVILPSCPTANHERADDVLLKTTWFLDDLLARFYGLAPFYQCQSREDLVGHLIIALAPHTSAGLVTRVIGFSRTQGFMAHPYVHQACRRDCDGDEIGFMLLLDGFINFSKSYLPASRGSTMDAPLVLTSRLIPSEVDEQAFNVGIGWSYPLEFYKAAGECKMPWEVQLPQIKNTLGTPAQFENHGFTHDTADINAGVVCSAYKTLPSMEDKLKGQMELAMRIRAVDAADVARLVIEKHFLKDTRGNLRQFSQQGFRCVDCNEKYRRPMLIGKCSKCGGKILFTVSEGSVIKYLEPTISLAKKYAVSAYLQQSIELLRRRIESMFGREKEKQTGLGAWFG